MGQCLGLSRRGVWRRGREMRHKAFEFAPKRSWKYKDANLLGQESDEGMSDGVQDMSPMGVSGSRPPVTMVAEDDSEEEIDTGQIRRSGLLSFQQQDSDSGEEEEEGGFQTTPLHAPGIGYQHLSGEEEEAEGARDRAPSSVSNTSQQIGRFEVLLIEEKAPEEVSALIDHTPKSILEANIPAQVQTAA